MPASVPPDAMLVDPAACVYASPAPIRSSPDPSILTVALFVAGPLTSSAETMVPFPTIWMTPALLSAFAVTVSPVPILLAPM